MLDILKISGQINIRWIPYDFSDDKSTLVQIMAWCCQPTSHYLNPCWLWSYRHMASLGRNESILPVYTLRHQMLHGSCWRDNVSKVFGSIGKFTKFHQYETPRAYFREIVTWLYNFRHSEWWIPSWLTRYLNGTCRKLPWNWIVQLH